MCISCLLCTSFLAVILGYNVLQINLLLHYLSRSCSGGAVAFTRGEPPRVTIRSRAFPYNEPYVAERLIDNIVTMEYPRDRLEIQVLDDSTDTTTELCENKAAFYREQGFDIQVIHRTDRSGFKAEP